MDVMGDRQEIVLRRVARVDGGVDVVFGVLD
jgi:hypothetical protein